MTAEPNQLKFYYKKMKLFYLFTSGFFLVFWGFWLLGLNTVIKESFVVWSLIIAHIFRLFLITIGAVCLYTVCVGASLTKPLITISDRGIEQEILFGKNIFISWSSILSFQYISVQKQVFLQITTVDQGSKELGTNMLDISAQDMMEVIIKYINQSKIKLPYLIGSNSELYDQENPGSFDMLEEAMDWLLQDKNNYRL